MISIAKRINLIKQQMYNEIYANINGLDMIKFFPDEDDKEFYSSDINFKLIRGEVNRTNSYLDVYEYIKNNEDFFVYLTSRNILRTRSIYSFVNKIANYFGNEFNYEKVFMKYSIYTSRPTETEKGIGIYFKYNNSNKDYYISR